MPEPDLQTTQNLSSVDPDEWNALTDGNPFLEHAFLSGLEIHGCLGPAVGWLPNHFLLRDGAGRLIGAMPAYVKTNSFGEFVFDWSWAAAYERAGLHYYPKLVCSIPFTPVTGPRLLTAAGADRDALADQLIAGAVHWAGENRLSGAHWLFPDRHSRGALEARELLPRLNYQYHWRNDGYQDFEHFLSFFRSRKRKNVRRERRLVRESGIHVRALAGNELDFQQWQTVYGFYRSTFLMKGNYPALTEAFFHHLARTMGANLVVVLAEKDGEPVAAAINLRSDTHLYGRYWGSNIDFDSLHFDVCFYHGIEYCIEHGLKVFEPGAQGEHKITRGFLPTETWSMHWIADRRFRAAIADFLERERDALRECRPELDALSPFRRSEAA